MGCSGHNSARNGILNRGKTAESIRIKGHEENSLCTQDNQYVGSDTGSGWDKRCARFWRFPNGTGPGRWAG